MSFFNAFKLPFLQAINNGLMSLVDLAYDHIIHSSIITNILSIYIKLVIFPNIRLNQQLDDFSMIIHSSQMDRQILLVSHFVHIRFILY